MELTQIIANNIVHLLEEQNRTQGELSTYIEVSRQTLANYLKGTSTIDSVRLVKTAKFFDVPVTQLLEERHIPHSPMLFRTNAKTFDSVESVQRLVFDYIEHYVHLLSQIGISSRVFPERYDLFIEHRGEHININYELYKRPPVKYRIDDQLRKEIYSIADAQRRLLGLNNSGAIELIPALRNHGINVFFIDFDLTSISGISIINEDYGCYIFINSNSSITVERQLFTVAHELGHILLHRPLFSQEMNIAMPSQYLDLLDSMADTFAGRLLCPPEFLNPFKDEFSGVPFRQILFNAIKIKQKLHVSLQSLILSLSRYDIIDKSTTAEFFDMIRRTHTQTIEPYSIGQNEALMDYFNNVKNEFIIELFRDAYLKKQINKDEIALLLQCSEDNVDQIMYVFDNIDAFL